MIKKTNKPTDDDADHILHFNRKHCIVFVACNNSNISVCTSEVYAAVLDY